MRDIEPMLVGCFFVLNLPDFLQSLKLMSDFAVVSLSNVDVGTSFSRKPVQLLTVRIVTINKFDCLRGFQVVRRNISINRVLNRD